MPQCRKGNRHIRDVMGFCPICWVAVVPGSAHDPYCHPWCEYVASNPITYDDLIQIYRSRNGGEAIGQGEGEKGEVS
jgi:hypothetical protein